MTVPSSPRRAGPFTGTGALVSYPFSFKVFGKTDLRVVVADDYGVESTLTLDSSVLVTLNVDQELNPGGSVQYANAGAATALPSGFSLVILSALAYSQETDLPEGGSYRAKAVEGAMDALAIQIQQVVEQGARALVLSPLSSGVSAQLPLPAAGKVLGWNGALDGLVNVDPGTGGGGGGGDPTLRTDLANTALGARGAGLVGFADTLTYTAGSVGEYLARAPRRAFGLDVLSLMPSAKRAAIIAGTSTDDHLADVQAIINAASFTTTRQLRFRAGKWNFSAPPRLYYHAADNPGHNPERNAKWEIIGEGRAQENYPIYSSPHGTIFNLQATTGDGFIVSPASLDAGPFLGRDFSARDITFVGGPSGYLVRCNGVPQARFYNCDFVQTSATGNGLHISTAYFGGLFGCRFRTTVAPSGNTAITLTVNSVDAPGAGLFKIADTDIQGHSTSFHFQSGSWTNINFDNAEFRSYSGGRGVYIEGFLDQLTMDGCYFEGAGVNWLADAGAERLKSLVMTGCWGVGRALTGSAAIDITEPDAVTITSGTYQDLVLPFLRIQGVPDSASSRGSYQVLGPSFKFYDTVAAPLTLFSGIIPAIHGAEISGGATGISTVKLFNASAKWPIDGKPFFSANSAMLSAGHVRQTHSALFSPAIGGTLYTHASTEYAAVVMLATSSGTPVFELKNGLTAKLGDLFTVDIINVGAGTVTVRREVGSTTIMTLAANSKVRLFWSDLFNDWL